MSSNQDLVAAVFEHQHDAEQAVADLWKAGFARERVDMVSRSQGVTQATPGFTLDKDAADGAIYGALAGTATGTIAGGLAFLLIPGLGAVIGGGLLAGLLGGAALGAAGGSFLGPFAALAGDEAAPHYNQALEEGRIIVLVHAFDRADEARALLQKHGGRELSQVHTVTVG
jgi:hypothetical protein